MKFAALLSVALGLFSASEAAAVYGAQLAKRTARTSPPSGCKTVRGSGTLSGEYATLTAALASLSTSSTAAACIFIYSGTYNEAVYINYKGALTLYGYTSK